ncbi:MAG: DpnI domain-containing protein [Bacteroidales bacterium]|nr:DpnI domain-containing protein [Bacteroidales bacterium]MDD4703396.1 DpnI domain-containing protein [Bacteroidales bacterium]
MNLHFESKIAEHYKSRSQIIRVLTEDWIKRNQYCPICGNDILTNYEANKPVADFYCLDCKSDFELKSKENKKGLLGNKIADGAYNTMIDRITSMQNPNFLFLTYNNNSVNNLILIPNHFFVPSIIEKRKALSDNARRAGWVGCNINIGEIPDNGKIFIIKNNFSIEREKVISNYNKTKSLQTSNLESRGWIMDILICINKIPTDEFSLKQMYDFENELKLKHPENNFIKDKIRQQLQYLRDKGFIEFKSPGNYKKIL